MQYKEWLRGWLENYITPIIIQRYVTELSQSGNVRTRKGLSSKGLSQIVKKLRQLIFCF